MTDPQLPQDDDSQPWEPFPWDHDEWLEAQTVTFPDPEDSHP